MIIGIILFTISSIGLFIYAFTSKDLHSPILFMIAILMIIGFGICVSILKEEEVAIACLKNKNPYKMEVKYILKDSIYVPIDTLYTKIK